MSFSKNISLDEVNYSNLGRLGLIAQGIRKELSGNNSLQAIARRKATQRFQFPQNWRIPSGPFRGDLENEPQSTVSNTPTTSGTDEPEAGTVNSGIVTKRIKYRPQKTIGGTVVSGIKRNIQGSLSQGSTIGPSGAMGTVTNIATGGIKSLFAAGLTTVLPRVLTGVYRGIKASNYVRRNMSKQPTNGVKIPVSGPPTNIVPKTREDDIRDIKNELNRRRTGTQEAEIRAGIVTPRTNRRLR
jgi:hypothetical protein